MESMEAATRIEGTVVVLVSVCLRVDRCCEQDEKRCLLASTSHPTLANQQRVNLKARELFCAQVPTMKQEP